MYKYSIISTNLAPQGYFLIKVSLNEKHEHIIVFKFMNGFIKDLLNNAPSQEEIENTLKPILKENDNFLLIRLVRIALGNETIKEQLRAKQNGIFSIDTLKWQQILNKVKEEELELILAQGLPN